MLISVNDAAVIGVSVALILVIVLMILVVVLVRQCYGLLSKRAGAVRQQRKMSVTEPVKPTFNWHHSIRISGTPPPTYVEAKDLPPLENCIAKMGLSAILSANRIEKSSSHSGTCTDVLTRQDTDSLHSGTEQLSTAFGNANPLLSDSPVVNSETSVSIKLPSSSEVKERS